MTTLRGSTSEFPLESVVGLLAGTSKTGELQVRRDERIGALGFAEGHLVTAVIEDDTGDNALGAIFALEGADFEFTSWANAPEPNLEAGDLASILKRAGDARDRLAAIRELIPHDRIRFKLSEKAADHGAVTFTPERWRALLAVNGERDVLGIAEQLRLSKIDALALLAGLVRDSVIETFEPPAAPRAASGRPPAAEVPPSAPESPAPASGWSSGSSATTTARSEARSAETSAADAWAQTPVEARAPEPPRTGSSSPPTSSAWDTAEPSIAVRSDLHEELAERLGGFEPTETAETPPAAPPPQGSAAPRMEDRLASLTGIFAPGPAGASTPPTEERAARQPYDPWSAQPSTTRPPESWTTPSPAVSEPPKNAWAPSAPTNEAQATPPAWTPPEAPASERAPEWPPPTSTAEAPAEKKRGLFGMFRRDEPATVTQLPTARAHVASRAGMVASFANALLVEYNSGAYGKGKVESRMSNLLMRVDELADPIDRPLPIVDDLIDATALEREGFPEEQVAPYLATLVRTVYDDAERAFGKDKAKRGYKAAQQQVFKSDTSPLAAPDVASKLPRV